MTDPASDLTALIGRLERYIDAPGVGLPEEVFLFLSRITPLVNVDLLIQDNASRTLLTWRSDRFFGPGWHVPGGIIRHKEAAADRIHAVAGQELGVSVTFDPVPILVHEGIQPGWRDRGHTIALLYRCRLTSDPAPRSRYNPQAPLPDQWQWHEHCPDDLIPEQKGYAAFMG